MKQEFRTQLNEYRQINKIAKKGEVVFLGSTFMYEFPFGELCKMLCTEDRIYNRSVRGLTVKDALEVYHQAVSPLAPKKLFINLGEEEKDSSFIDDYRRLIQYIKKDSPKTKILLFSVLSADAKKCRFNNEIKVMAEELDVKYVDSMDGMIGSKGNLTSPFIDEDEQLTLMAYISFWRKAYHYLRDGNISYYDAFSISNAAMMAQF